jgi:glycosyltransferase involved in cell wall biosynthesis
MTTTDPGRSGPRVSVVVATRNRAADIDHLLAAVAAADTGVVHEVILVDDASSTPLRVDECATFPVRILRNERRRGAAASRNRAAEVAGGEILAFLDDDARPLPDWFHVVESALTADRAGITGRVLGFDSTTVARARQHRYEARYAQHAPGSAVGFFAGGNSAVWTNRFLAAGGFPDIIVASDNALVDGLAREGGRVHFVPELRVAHRNSKGPWIAFREAWRAGRLASRVGPGTAVCHLAKSTASQPWRSDPAASCLNVSLQAANSLATALPVG